MTLIAGVTLTRARLRFRAPLRHGAERRSSQEVGILQVVTDDGRIGLGEMAGLTLSTDLDAEVEAVARQVLGRDPRDGAVTEHRSLGGALASALLDLRGQVEGRSVAAILGAHRSDVAVNGLLALGNDVADGDALAAAALVAAGYRTIKLKRPIDGRAIDVALRTVREAVGPLVALRLDLNGELDESTAIGWLRTLASLDLEYVEQPIAPSLGMTALARVRRAIPMPLAADESVTDPDAASSLLAAEACDVLVIKPSRVGGPHAAVAIARLAEQAGVGATVSTLYESGIGLASALHVAAALAGDGAHGLSTGALLVSDLVRSAPQVVGGRLSVPAAAGLGVMLDVAALADASALADATVVG